MHDPNNHDHYITEDAFDEVLDAYMKAHPEAPTRDSQPFAEHYVSTGKAWISCNLKPFNGVWLAVLTARDEDRSLWSFMCMEESLYRAASIAKLVYRSPCAMWPLLGNKIPTGAPEHVS